LRFGFLMRGFLYDGLVWIFYMADRVGFHLECVFASGLSRTRNPRLVWRSCVSVFA
jgi:hypothetical protein